MDLLASPTETLQAQVQKLELKAIPEDGFDYVIKI